MKVMIGKILKMVMIDDRRIPHAAGDQVVEQPHPEGRDPDGEQGVAVAQLREESTDRCGHEYPVECVAGARAGPEADGGVEAHVVAEPRLGVDENTGVEVGLPDRQGLENEGQHEHSGARHDPGDQSAGDAGSDAEARG